MPRCQEHKIPLITVQIRFCPACRGSVVTGRKAQASRENGRRGGRPVGSKDSKPRKRRKVVKQ